MGFKDITHTFELQAARGNLKPEYIPLMESVTLAELAADQFGRAFYGRVWDKAKEDVAKRREQPAVTEGFDATIRRWETLARDVGNLPAALARETILTTLDLPAVLGRARDLVIRPPEEPVNVDSQLMNAAAKAVHPNFKPRPTLRKDLDLLGLFPQPEGTNVRYEAFTWTEDEYAVAKYSRAIGWTWESRLADDLQAFLDESAALGYAARLNRIRILFAAIIAATSRTTPSGTNEGGTAAAGGPTIANLTWARNTLAANTPPRRFGAISIPINWEGLANAARDNQFIPASSPAQLNPVYQTFIVNVEEAMPAILSAAPSGSVNDWLAYDPAIATWLEFARLTGFEGGPRVIFKLPDTRDTTEFGSFDNMTDAMKVVDAVGAKVTEPSKVLRVAGA